MVREHARFSGLGGGEIVVESEGDHVVLSINRRKSGGTTQTVRLDAALVERLIAELVKAAKEVSGCATDDSQGA